MALAATCHRIRKLCSRYQRSAAPKGPSATLAREQLRAGARRAAGGCATKPRAKCAARSIKDGPRGLVAQIKFQGVKRTGRMAYVPSKV